MKAAGVFISGTIGGIAQMVWTAAVFIIGASYGRRFFEAQKRECNCHGKSVENSEGGKECQK